MSIDAWPLPLIWLRLDLALTAAWTIIDSQAMPVLLEGILLLGTAVSDTAEVVRTEKVWGDTVDERNSKNHLASIETL